MATFNSMPGVGETTGVPSSGFNRHSHRYKQISRSVYFGGHATNLHDLYNRSVPQQQVADYTSYSYDFFHCDENVKNYNTKQSRHLPAWAWYVIASILGIRKRYWWLGIVFYVVTIVLALTFLTTFTWYTLYDVTSHFTKSTALTGTMSLLIALYWCALGIFANRMAKKLFRSRTFVDSVRLHSKRVLKISGSLLLFILAVVILALDSYNVYYNYGMGQCRNITIPNALCPVLISSRISYSILNVLWNLLVGFVMLSVCRTHTIGIRRFIKELEDDGKIYEELFNQEVAEHLQQSGAHGHSMGRTGEHLNFTDEGENNEDYMNELNELNEESSEEKWLDDDNSDDEIRHPAVCSVYDIHGILPGTVRRRRRLFSSRLSLRGSHSSIYSSLAQSGGIVPGGGGAGHRQAPPDATLATIHSQEALDTASGSQPVTRPKAETHLNKAFDDETKPLIDLEESAAVETQPAGEEPTNSHATSGNDSNTGSQCPQANCISPDDSKDPNIGAKTTPKEDEAPSEIVQEEDNGSESCPVGAPPAVHESMMLTNDEILLAYWKIQVRMCMTSLALQRWLTMWIVFILLWAAMFLIELVSEEARIVDIAQFVLTILIIPLLCSAYGEVNYETKRMIRRICPAPWRVEMLFYLDQMPLQLTAYGSPVNYGVISTTIAALGLAFFTKMVLTDVNWTG